MNRRQFIAAAAALSVLAGAGSVAEMVIHANPATTPAAALPSVSDPIRQQVRRMTLEEKIGQLMMVGVSGTTAGEEARKMVTRYHVGGFILYQKNIKSIQQTTDLLNDLKHFNANGPAPLFFGVDQEGGRVDRLANLFGPLPSSREVGAFSSPTFSEAIGADIGEELRSLGFNMDFAPDLDVDSNPDNPVIGDRSFSSSPELVSLLGTASMQGIRSKGIIPVIKHFPGHGDTSVDSHLELPRVDKTFEELKKLELVPFADAIKEQADAVMVAHILLPKLDPAFPASFSKAIITGLLRQDLHFDGVVMTDDMTMGAVLKTYPVGEAAVRAVAAGADIVLVAHDQDREEDVILALIQSAKNGTLPVARIDESVYRVLKLKQKYRISDQAVSQQDAKTVTTRIQETVQSYMGLDR